MKKIFCLIISAIYILTVLTLNVYAEDYTVYDESKQKSDFFLLQELSIINGLDYESLNTTDTVSKSTLINYLVNIISNEGADVAYNKEILKKAESWGLIVSADDIKEDQILVADEAVAMAVRVLGYDIVAKEGGYPQGYYNIAHQEGLLKGLELNGNVTYAQMIELLRNLIEAEHPEIEMNSYGNTLNTSSTWPVLEYYRDIYCIKGVVTANSDTSLYSTTGVGKGLVTIDGNAYDAGESNAADLLGHRVKAYIQRDKSDEDKILYVVDISNNELVIDADLVESVSDDCRTIQYYQNKNSTRTKRIKISADAAFMLNGVAYADCKPSDFIREGTKIVIVENKSGEYNFVNLIYAETMIASAVSTSLQTITNEYQFEGVIKKLDLSDLNDEEYSIYKDGKTVSLADIAIGDVLSVYRTETGKVKIEAQANAFEGKVSSCSSEDVTIDGTEYELSELYQIALKNNESAAQKIESGVSYTFRLNANGNIISASFLPMDNLTYGYVTRIWEDEELDERGIKIFLSDGSWQNYEFADKVKWNGKRVKTNTLINNDEILASIPGLVGINFDKDKQINVLETPIEYHKSLDPKRLNTTGEQTYTYRWNGYTFSNYYYMSPNTTVFIIPDDPEAEQSNYRVSSGSSAFWSGRTYKFIGYNRDEYYNLDMVVSKRSIKDIQEVDSDYFMIRGKGVTLDDNDEVSDYIKVASRSYAGVTFVGKQGLFDTLDEGDLIKVHFDAAGKIDNYELIVAANGEHDKYLPPDSDRDGGSSIVRGFAEKTDPATGSIIIDTESQMCFKANPNQPVLFYDGNEVSLEPFSCIERGDYLAIGLESSAVSMVVVYRDNL